MRKHTTPCNLHFRPLENRRPALTQLALFRCKYYCQLHVNGNYLTYAYWATFQSVSISLQVH
jgi:hypothetical protein